MAYRNRVELIGRLGDNPEIIDLDDDRIAVNISIATTKKYRDPDTGDIKENTEWHDIAIYGHTADFAAEYLVKGMLVSVVASLRTRQFKDRETQKTRRVKEIVVNERQHEVQILSWPKEKEEEEEKPARRTQPKGQSRASKPKSNSRTGSGRQRAASNKPPRKPQPRKEEPVYDDEDEDDTPPRSRSYSNRDEVDVSQYQAPPSDWDEENDPPF